MVDSISDKQLEVSTLESEGEGKGENLNTLTCTRVLRPENYVHVHV